LKGSIIILLLLWCRTGTAQKHIAADAIRKVDSIAASAGPGSAFARLYIQSMNEIEKQLFVIILLIHVKASIT
jgi:hypothetical protein